MAAAACAAAATSSWNIAAVAGDRNFFQVSSISSAKRNNLYSISMGQSSPCSPPLRLGDQALGISQTFSNLKTQGKVAFIPYITAGDPDLSTTAETLKLLSSCGADIIELGLPFSDPIMDGPVIQASNKRALANKTDVKGVLSMLKEVVPQISCPIVVFTYFSLILRQEDEWFLSSLQDAGVRGLIVPDLPFEESASLKEEAAEKNIDMVFFTTPTTTRTKMKVIADASEGFIYLISSAGVTGARSTVNPQVEYMLKEIKKETTKPVAVGFGISNPEHVRQLSSWGADGVIVGSAIVKVLGEAKSKEEGLKQTEYFVKSLVDALPSGKHRPHTMEACHLPPGTSVLGDWDARKRRLSWHGSQYGYSLPNLLASEVPTKNKTYF